MSANFEAKKVVVEEIKEKIQNSKSVVFVKFSGLTVAEDTELRREFRKNNVEYKVLKNTLIRRAFNDLGITDFDEDLNGPTSVAFGADDTSADTVSKYVALEDKVYSFSGTAKFSYKKDSKNTSVLYTDATKLFVRKAATKDDNRKLNGFASAAAEVKIGKAAQK